MSLRSKWQRFWQNEKGAVLAGSLAVDGSWIVSHVMPPSKSSLSGRNWLERDHPSAIKYLDGLFEKSGGSIRYMGEWHTHPFKSLTPSQSDFNALFKLMEGSQLEVDFVLGIIVDPKQNLIVWCQFKDHRDVEVKILSEKGIEDSFKMPAQT